MIDFGKLYCNQHSNELITNFCLKQSCLVGLCATCICSHTDQHIHNKTCPQYQNIRTTYSSLHQLLRIQISKIDNQKSRIDKIMQFISSKRNSVKQNIQQIRQETVDAVNNFFQQKQKNILREIQTQEKKLGLHCEQRMESLMNTLCRETTSLLTAAQELNSQNFLQSYQRIKIHTVINASKLQEEVSTQLSHNQDFETIINSNNDYIQNILHSLQNSINLTFKINHQPLFTNRKQATYNNESAVLLNNIRKEMIDPNNNTFGFKNANSSSSTFSFVPQLIKQQTGNFNQRSHSTTKSIPLKKQQKLNRSPSLERLAYHPINSQMYRSQIIKQATPIDSINNSRYFRQQPQNQPYNLIKPQQLKNLQSQIVFSKPQIARVSTKFINNSLMRHHPTQSGLYNENANSDVIYPRNNNFTPSHSRVQQTNFYINSNQPNFGIEKSIKRGPENMFSLQSKKIRKSGLSLIKASTATFRNRDYTD